MDIVLYGMYHFGENWFGIMVLIKLERKGLEKLINKF
jgi:hypothetical protein